MYRSATRAALEPRGFEVVPLASVDQIFAQHRVRPADLLILALEAGSGGAVALTRRLQSDTQRPPPGLLVVTSAPPGADPDLRTLGGLFEAFEVLVRPYGALDLLDRVDSVARRVRASTAERGGPRPEAPAFDPRTLSLLARLWASRATGLLVIEQAGAEHTVRLAQGGLTDPEARALVFAALRGSAELRFEAADLGERGDPAMLGELLWRAARDPRQTRLASEHRYEALSRTPWTNAALTLPIGDPVRRLLSAADGQATLGELIARLAVDAESASIDLHALRQLRLVVFQAPVTRARKVSDHRPDVSAPPAPQPAAGGNETIALNVWHDPSTQPGARSIPPTPAGGAGTSAGAREPGRGGDARLHSSSSDGHTTLSERRRAAIASSLRSALGHTGLPTATATATATGTSNLLSRNRASIAQVMKSLERDLDVVRAAPPAVVLSIPADSPPDQVRKAAERHRQRYLTMERDEQLPAEARQLARDVLRRVEEAERDWGRASVAPVSPMDADRLYESGRAQIGRQDWQGAEATLSRARSVRADHAGVLALLGWARFNNTRHGMAERTKDARELLMLAEQFDPNNAEAQYYLAELLYRLGEYDAALPRASRAMKAQPENPAVALLYRKLRSRLTS